MLNFYKNSITVPFVGGLASYEKFEHVHVYIYYDWLTTYKTLGLVYNSIKNLFLDKENIEVPDSIGYEIKFLDKGAENTKFDPIFKITRKEGDTVARHQKILAAMVLIESLNEINKKNLNFKSTPDLDLLLATIRLQYAFPYDMGKILAIFFDSEFEKCFS